MGVGGDLGPKISRQGPNCALSRGVQVIDGAQVRKADHAGRAARPFFDHRRKALTTSLGCSKPVQAVNPAYPKKGSPSTRFAVSGLRSPASPACTCGLNFERNVAFFLCGTPVPLDKSLTLSGAAKAPRQCAQSVQKPRCPVIPAANHFARLLRTIPHRSRHPFCTPFCAETASSFAQNRAPFAPPKTGNMPRTPTPLATMRKPAKASAKRAAIQTAKGKPVACPTDCATKCA